MLHYLVGVGIEKALELFGFCDFNWGGNIDTKRSPTSYIFLLGGATISWAGKK